MSIVCPTVTAFDLTEFSRQLKQITSFSDRVHIDLMDGIFAPTKSPSLKDIRLPHDALVDIHLMYQEPMDVLEDLIRLKPNMVIVHNEAHVHHMHLVAELDRHKIKSGLAILQDTPVDYIRQISHSFDHVLVFSGNLGHHGGSADLSLIDKVKDIRKLLPHIEIGWDGGISDRNAKDLVKAGVDVLNVGGYIQKSSNPEAAYGKLLVEIGET